MNTLNVTNSLPNEHNTPRWTITLIVVICALLGLIACSGSDGDGDNEPRHTPTPTIDAPRIEQAIVIEVASIEDIAWRGVTLAVGGDTGIQLYQATDVDAGATILTDIPVLSVAFNDDGRQLAAAGADEIIYVWDVATTTEMATLEGHTGPIVDIAFGSDGTRLVSGGGDAARIWNVSTGEEIASVNAGMLWQVQSVAISPDGLQVAFSTNSVTSSGLKIRLLDATTAQEQALLEGHERRVWDVSFSPAGTTLASGSDDGTVRMWDIATGATTTIFNAGDIAQSTAFSPDGQRIAAVGAFDHLVRVWDVASGEFVSVLEGHTALITDVAFSPDGTQLATASQDGTVRIWTLP